MQRHLLAQGHDSCLGPPSLSSSGGTFGGGSGGGVPRMFSRTHTPRFTGEVRKFCSHVTDRKLPCPSSPRRYVQFRPERHAAELRAVDVRDAVVLRQPLVHKRVVGGQQIDDVAVFADDALEEQFRFTPEALPQFVVPVRDRTRRRATSPADSAGTATDRRNSRPAPAIVDRPASAAPAARAQLACCRLFLRRQIDQFIVRDAAPQEERKPRSQFQIGDAIGFAGATFAGSRFGAHQELRARQHPAQRQLDAVFKRSFAAAFLVEAHHPLQILRSHRTPERAPRQRRKDLLRAGLFLAALDGLANEDLPHAARILGTRGVERPLNPKQADRRIVLQAAESCCFRAICVRIA